MTVPVINALSACYVTASYFDQYDEPYVPAGVLWKLEDVTNEVDVIGWSSLVPSGVSDTITIDGPQNALANPDNLTERRQVIFKVTAPDGTFRYDYYPYDLLNVQGAP
jgi:hypothetical protein